MTGDAELSGSQISWYALAVDSISAVDDVRRDCNMETDPTELMLSSFTGGGAIM